MLQTRRIAAVALALALAACAATATAAADRPPNLIIILADDLGYADVGFNGCRDIPTPNIDSLARDGVRCSDGYVTHPFCSPTRAGLLTGRYQQRFGHENNPVYNPEDTVSGLPTSEVLLPQVLKDAGYISGIVGKWHLGAAERFHPLNRGFDEFFGFLGGGHQYFPERWGGKAEYTTDLMRGRAFVKEDEYLTDAFAREAEAFVERHRDRPFFLYLAFNAPHTPLQAPPRYLDRFRSIADEKRRTYAAMISALDDGVGRLLAKLRAHRLEERTLVVFLSDNGGPIGDRGNGSSNGPLRAGKGTTYEGGIRVPYALRWTGTLRAGTVYEHPVSSLDLFATAVALGAASPAPGRPLDGVDLIPYLRGDKSGPPHEALFWRTGGGTSFAARLGPRKLVEPRPGKLELYDLARDTAETNDLAPAQADAVRQLARLKDAWSAQLIPPIFPGAAGARPGDATAKGAAR
jgi:arylsulfatase A-like enzyme